MTAWQVGWLNMLANEYDREHDWGADIDPTATAEMLREVRAVHAELAATHTGCAGCRIVDATQPDGYCDVCRPSGVSVVADSEIPF